MNNYIIFVNGRIVSNGFTVREKAKASAQKKSSAYPKLVFEVVAEDVLSGCIHTIALYENGKDIWN